VKQLLYNNCLSFRQLKYGESHMTYLARNRVKRPGSAIQELCIPVPEEELKELIVFHFFVIFCNFYIALSSKNHYATYHFVIV
jgi:hypothetical protein